jgi:hypothetical protein
VVAQVAEIMSAIRRLKVQQLTIVLKDVIRVQLLPVLTRLQISWITLMIHVCLNSRVVKAQEWIRNSLLTALVNKIIQI